jgi:diguanylate cyclase (GGDEF)-like protein
MNALEVFQKALRELSGRYARELPQKLAEIDAIWESASTGPHRQEALAALQRLVHGLDVSASMLSVPALSEPARRLARLLEANLGRAGALPADTAETIESLLADLHRAAEPGTLSHRFDNALSSHPRYLRGHESRELLLLEPDAGAAASLGTQLERFGYQVSATADPEKLAEGLALRRPYAVLVDAGRAGREFLAAQVTGSLAHAAPDRPPVMVLAERGDLAARLDAVRAGAAAYFTKPVRVPELVEHLDRLATWETPEPYRVLMVDADAGRAEFCRAVLRESGMDVTVVTDPWQSLNVIQDVRPELLLVALELPGLSGDELATVVHQMPSHLSLPVVFLADRWDFERRVELLNQGGDALLPVPVRSHQLIATVIARMERHRTLSRLTQQDSLTGLLNHSRLQQYLEIEVVRAARQYHPLSFAMIDLDHFKAVNDQHGHPIGDRVLKNLSRFLRQALRKSDVVGRYGGEEFGVIFTDTEAPRALAVMEKLCRDFAALEHEAEKGSFRVTFSAGIATLNGGRSSRDLVVAANRALYEAKRQGRNRVVLAPPPGMSGRSAQNIRFHQLCSRVASAIRGESGKLICMSRSASVCRSVSPMAL